MDTCSECGLVLKAQAYVFQGRVVCEKCDGVLRKPKAGFSKWVAPSLIWWIWVLNCIGVGAACFGVVLVILVSPATQGARYTVTDYVGLVLLIIAAGWYLLIVRCLCEAAMALFVIAGVAKK